MIGQGRNKAQPPLAALNAGHAGRAGFGLRVGLVGGHGNQARAARGFLRMSSADQKFSGLQSVPLPMGMNSMKRRSTGMVQGRVHKIVHLTVVDAPHGHHIDFHPHARRQQAVQRGQHRGQQIPARDPREGLAVKAVQGKVDRAHADPPQQGNMRLQQGAVSGHAQIHVRKTRVQHSQELAAPLAGKRLPAGQAHLADAQGSGNAHHARHFLIAQDLLMGNAALFGVAAAVQAAQIAAVRH